MNIRRELKGICSVECGDAAAVRLMNICSHRGVRTWCDVKRRSHGFYIYKSDCPMVKNVSEKYGLEVTIREVRSFRSFVRDNRKRISFAAGILIFGVIVYIQSLYIWHIDITGCGDYTDEEIFDFIQVAYPCIGKRKSEIDLGELRDKITDNYSDVCWASCSVSGTLLTVELKESVDMFTATGIDEPSDLVAAMDCTIYSIVTSSGTPMAAAGDEVKKGDVLISGIVNICNDDSEVVETKCVAAQGEIYGVCRLPYKDVVEAVHYIKKPQPDYIREVELVTGSHITRVYTNNEKKENEDICTQQLCPHIGDLYLPISVNIRKSIPYQLETETYDDTQLKQLADRHLMSYIGKMQEKGVQILQKNVIITNGSDSVTAEGELTVILPVAKAVIINKDRGKYIE